MPAFQDLTGQHFGYLTVLSYAGQSGKSKHNRWWCVCDFNGCGTRKSIAAQKLKSGNTVSCGCFRKQTAAEQGHKNTEHGFSHTPTHEAWGGMFQRCYNTNDLSYKHYGARGIIVCERWHDFVNFLADMGEKPSKMTLERKNVNGPYSPDNCVWATQKQQANNRRNNIFLEHNGKRQTIAAWAEELGMHDITLYWRIKQGWSTEKAFFTPIVSRNKPGIILSAFGKQQTIRQWALEIGISRVTILNRLKKGLTPEQILTQIQ